jgi:hypothetical protein
MNWLQKISQSYYDVGFKGCGHRIWLIDKNWKWHEDADPFYDRKQHLQLFGDLCLSSWAAGRIDSNKRGSVGFHKTVWPNDIKKVLDMCVNEHPEVKWEIYTANGMKRIQEYYQELEGH